ncbi:3-methylfumaryl-CoA hydratase [Actinomycetospora succinea]|uniref:3-methylfumaryl-CoA hydratase n=1 Tax=Actinomycetospora succinea TaxID=663603 RepID=A0A4R6V1X8_9PSEU|nr:MaoC family dehydratase N-terminal domain-containing protein [Actinomycetospora succinea]TDQ53903.1 3-methylfumaryl-CoA hydratase [Actinomycetospora succinea]
MPDDPAAVLAAVARDWEPPVVATSRRVDPWTVAAFADLIDAPGPTDDALPPLWHWFTLLDHPRTAAVGEDGHPADGPFLPPVPGRRRMIAGGRLRMTRDVPVGATLHSRSRVADVTPKSGRSGAMLFVTVRHELTVDDDPAVVAVEEQDVVYRSEPEGAERRVTPRPDGGEPEPAGEWRLDLPTDPVLLSRFSALTYNGHRIHYDRPYVTEVEGYPDLVVHGPLMALLALELPRRYAPGEALAEVEYRLARPAFVPSPLVAAGRRDRDTVTIAVAAQGAAPSLTATTRFR